MATVDTFHLPRETRATITPDANASGHLVRIYAGAQPTNFQTITASTAIELGPFNTDRDYRITLTGGSYTMTQDFAGSDSENLGGLKATITSPQENDVLSYDETAGRFLNEPATGGTGTSVVYPEGLRDTEAYVVCLAPSYQTTKEFNSSYAYLTPWICHKSGTSALISFTERGTSDTEVVLGIFGSLEDGTPDLTSGPLDENVGVGIDTLPVECQISGPFERGTIYWIYFQADTDEIVFDALAPAKSGSTDDPVFYPGIGSNTHYRITATYDGTIPTLDEEDLVVQSSSIFKHTISVTV